MGMDEIINYAVGAFTGRRKISEESIKYNDALAILYSLPEKGITNVGLTNHQSKTKYTESVNRAIEVVGRDIKPKTDSHYFSGTHTVSRTSKGEEHEIEMKKTQLVKLPHGTEPNVLTSVSISYIL